MRCSNSISNPNSNWLDRLRTSKGFPISTDLDNLDQFLTSNSNPNPNPNPNPIENPPSKPPHERRDHRSLFHLMTNVLSDLFVMGNPSNPNPIKSSRKQPNPRSHNGASSQSSANNSVAEGKKRKLKARKKMGGSDEGSKSKDPELLGFSRTEVTVIDTSLSPDWKAARVVYRKGMVWKVREKKGVRVRRRKKKKRKVGLVEKLGFEKEREREREKCEVGIKGEGRKVQLALLNKDCAQNDKEENSKEMGDQILIPRRRPKFSRSPRIPAKNSNVLRLKVICSGESAATNTLQGKMKGIQGIL